MSSFDIAIDFVLKNEGGFSNNSHDKGGFTNYGISLRFLKNISLDHLKVYHIFEVPTEQTIQDLTIEQAKKIYYGEFWMHAPFEQIVNQEQCNYIFDMAINMGIAPAIKCLQRAIWAVLKRRDIIDDGILGHTTLEALQRCGFLVSPPLRSERAGFYRLIAQESGDNTNLHGWLNRAYESN